jgi:diphthamide synthase (EF-2-diphthine--ammonia ligase)
VDPCGEFGEFHTFCHDGPIFREAIPYRLGETVLKSYNIKKDDGSKVKKGFFFIEVLE